METNFDYLLKKEEYADFAKQAVEAEKSLSDMNRLPFAWLVFKNKEA